MISDMEKANITDTLDKLLMAIHRQVVNIRDTDGRIPKIEMDKTLSNIRALYEQFTVLNYLNAQMAENAEPAAQPKPVPSTVEPEPAKQPVPEPVKPVESPFVPIVEKQPEPVKQETPAYVQPEPIKTEQQPIQPEPVKAEPQPPIQPVQPVAQPQPVKQAEPEPVKPVAQAPAASVGDERFRPKNVAIPVDVPPAGRTPLETQEPVTLADRLRQQKLDDLHKAVSLSDKFLYMNELFEGENNAYKEALDMLNRLTDTSGAEHYLDALAQRYNWGKNAKTEKKFRELVARKFL